jgi:hypothetical protein
MKKIATILGLFALTACTKNDFPVEVVTNFMNQCSINSGGNAVGCACMLGEIQAKMNIEEFTKLEQRLALGDPEALKSFLDITATCRK